MVNCDVEVELATKHSIRGFPSLLLFYNGELIAEYHKGRSLEDLKSFLATIDKPRKNRDGQVDTLTDSNFDAETCIIESPVMVKFYSPNCGHCVQLAPVWVQLAAALKNTDIRVVEIDCSSNQHTCNRYGVAGYPTIKFLKNGIQAEFTGGERTLSALLHFAKSGWKDVEKKSRPGMEATSNIDWKLIAIVVALFVVLFCGCVVVVFWVTNDDYASVNDLKEPLAPVKRPEKMTVVKPTKND